jgi:hypothetical protein
MNDKPKQKPQVTPENKAMQPPENKAKIPPESWAFQSTPLRKKRKPPKSVQ